MASYSSLASPAEWAWNIGLFGVGAAVMRGAGCVINDLWDRDIDKKVGSFTIFLLLSYLRERMDAETGAFHRTERTKLRPLASGEVKPLQALTFLGGQLSVGLAILTQLNWYS